MKNSNYVREPIALFRQIKENKKPNNPLDNLKSACPKELKIGAAIMTGDCFFDSVAQGLNELKLGHHFTAKSLRKDCADYARANKKSDQWVYNAVIRDAGEYFVPQKDPDGNVISENGCNKQDNIKSFFKYSNNIKSMATGSGSLPIWGRPNIEGRIICDKYKVELYIYSIEEDSQKVTVTKITAHDDESEVFIEGENLDQLKIDASKKTVGVVNYMRHFVPLLSGISEDIKESKPVSNEEILGISEEVSTFNQPEKKVQQESSASAPVYTNRKIPISHQPEQKSLKEEIQRRLTDSYRKEAIYSIVAVITAITFTASAIAATFTQPIPLACLAGVALVVACVCVYQLMQSHNDIHELKSELKENIAHTFLEETGLKINSLIDKAASKI